MDISIGQLRTLCNENDVSCRDAYGNLVNRTVLCKRLQLVQTGGAMSPKKVWAKYGTKLKDRLTKDVTYKGPVDSLPSAFTDKHPKYLEWMVTSYLNDGIRYYEDIKSRVHPALDNYLKLLHKRLLNSRDADGIPITDVKRFQQILIEKPWLNETNLLNYCGLRGCQSIIKKQIVQKLGLEDLLEKYSEDLDSLISIYLPDLGALYFDGETIRIYKLSNKEEACYYGRGTRWCTAARENNMFDEYNKADILYVIIPKKPQYEGEKYQIAISRDDGGIEQHMNEKDEPFEINELVTLYPETRQMRNIDEYVRYGRVFDKRIIGSDEYRLSEKEPETVGLGDLMIVRIRDGNIMDVGVIDRVEDKVKITQGKLESLMDGFGFLLEFYDDLWLLILLYQYIPIVVLNAHYIRVADMLLQEPSIMADGLLNHYDALVGVLVKCLNVFDVRVSTHELVSIVTAAASSARLDMYDVGRLGTNIAESISILADEINDDYVHTIDEILSIKLPEIIRKEINETPYEGYVGALEKDLYTKIKLYFHQKEDERSISFTSSSMYWINMFKPIHQTIKELYTALAPHGKLSLKIKQNALKSIKWLKIVDSNSQP
jgi:hypothetical protein